MNMLRAKLYQIEEDKKQAEADRQYSEKGDIGWGNQIRSYVFQPYQMVKDLRTGVESGNIQDVMDGNLDPFIEAMLRGQASATADVFPFMSAALTIDVLSLFPEMVEAPWRGASSARPVKRALWRCAATISGIGRRTGTARRTIIFAEADRGCC